MAAERQRYADGLSPHPQVDHSSRRCSLRLLMCCAHFGTPAFSSIWGMVMGTSLAPEVPVNMVWNCDREPHRSPICQQDVSVTAKPAGLPPAAHRGTQRRAGSQCRLGRDAHPYRECARSADTFGLDRRDRTASGNQKQPNFGTASGPRRPPRRGANRQARGGHRV